MKRLLIFVFYDKWGIVDSYIEYLLKDIVKNVHSLVVVVNGRCNEQGRKVFEKYADDILIRENTGYDVGAYKDAILTYIGIEKVKEYDEVIIMNDTFFGPFYPFQEIFKYMESKTVDFWGITLQETANLGYGIIPRNIQSYFVAFRKKVLHSVEFEDFWMTMEPAEQFMDACKNFENRLTVFFEEKGFKYSVFVEDDILNATEDMVHNYNHYWYLPYTLIRYHKMPFLKVKPFEALDVDVTMQEELSRAIQYVESHYSYDSQLIWEHLLRKISIDRLIYSANMFRILNTEQKVERIADPAITVAIFIGCDKTIFFWNESIRKLAEKYTVMLLTDKPDIVTRLEDCFQRCQINIVCDAAFNQYSAWWYAISQTGDTELFSYLHDDEINEADHKTASYISYIRANMECMFYNESYISQIINSFQTEEKLGLFMAIPTYHAQYWMRNLSTADDKDEYVYRLCETFGMEVLDRDHFNKVMVENSFWCRASVLKKIMMKLEAISMEPDTLQKNTLSCLPQLFQYMGLYSSYIMDSSWAAINIKNKSLINDFTKREINFDKNIEIKDYEDFRNTFRMWALNHKLRNYAKKYIYGAGNNAKTVFKLLKREGIEIDNFLVSSLHNNPHEIEGVEVKELSRIVFSDRDAVILGLNADNTRQVLPKLYEKLDEANIFYP